MADDAANNNLPATAGDAALASAPIMPKRAGSDLIEGFYNLNIMRQVGLMVALAASVAIGGMIVLWAKGEDYRPLYGSIQNIDVSKVVQVLESNGIPYKVSEATGALLVADDQIHAARLKLADAGFPGQKAVGFELLDEEQPLGTSQFMETARFRRSLEGELGRTITSISAIHRARVHLALPKSTVFIRDKRKPTASVLVELFPGATLKPQQVRAIANLVASSIPELAIEDVAVVDQKGNLLSNFDDQEELLAMEKQLQYSRKIEENLAKRIDSILLPVVGEGGFKAEVSADVDFTEVEQTDEVFNPDLPAVRSEQTLEEQKAGADAIGGIPGALTNQPPGVGAAPEQATAGQGAVGANGQAVNSRRQATRNYELDRTISYTRHQVGKVRRLTVAVVVDDLVSVDPATGDEVRTPWDANDLERLAILVKDAVGFDPARGDSVNVINAPFRVEEPEQITFEEPPLWKQPEVEPYIRGGVVFLLGLLFLLLVVRPIMKGLTATAKEAEQDEAHRALAAAGIEEAVGAGGETLGLEGGENLLLPSPTESYEQQLNAVKGLIAEDPGRVAQVIKQWVNAGD